MIGDDIRTLLGMIPVRDRAGIARSNLAVEAEQSAARQSNGNAEGQELTRQGFMPPRVSLPPTMGQPQAPISNDIEPDAANLPVAGGAPAQFAAPPAPTERVVASAAAAAPRGSEIMLQALQRQAQQQKMMQVIGSLGMIANAFNRNPQSQAATRSSLAGMMSGGGGGGGGTGDLKTLLDMRAKEEEQAATAVAKENAVEQAQRMFGISREDAIARWDTGELKKLLDPATIAKREEDKRSGVVRQDLSKPEVITALAKRNGVPEEVIKADIANGKITSKDLVDIQKDLATTGKLGAETAETIQKTDEARKSAAAFTFYKDNPEAFARLHGIPVEEAQRIVGDRKAYDKYQETSGPTAYAEEAGYAQAKREGYKGSRADWKSIRPGVETPAELIEKERIKAVGKGQEKGETLRAERQGKAWDARKQIQTIYHTQQSLWSPDLVTGGGFAGPELEARRLAAKVMGMPDEAVRTTDTFQSYQKELAIRQNEILKGNTSNSDITLLQESQGSNKMDAETLRRRGIIAEKASNREIYNWNSEVDELQKKDPAKWGHLEKVPYPPPGPLIRREMETDFGKKLIAAMTNPPQDGLITLTSRVGGKTIKETYTVDEAIKRKWGEGTYDYLKSQQPVP